MKIFDEIESEVRTYAALSLACSTVQKTSLFMMKKAMPI
jgi:hypothetical protein